MTARATKRAIAANDFPEDDSDAVRIRQQLDAWAGRTPRLVATPAEDFSIEPPVRAPAKKRSRSAPAAARTKAARGTRKADAEKAELEKTEAAKADIGLQAANPAAEHPAVEAEPATPEFSEPVVVAPAAVAPVAEAPLAPVVPEPARSPRALTSRTFAVLAALALATVAAYFSVAGMAEIFPGDPVAVMVFAGTMEAGKLVIAGWLAAHWRRTGWTLRLVLVALVAGLALINAAGVFGKLVEAHVGAAATARSNVTERIETLDARLVAQTAVVADLTGRIAQIDRAIDESTKRGRVTRALNIATQERVTRDGLDAQRQSATATLVELQGQRAALVGERSRVEASAGPIQYLAMMAGIAPEEAVRWLILLMVLCCDPAAIALTVAAAGSRARET